MSLRFILAITFLIAAGCTSTITSEVSKTKTRGIASTEVVDNLKLSPIEKEFIAKSPIEHLYAPPERANKDKRGHARKDARDVLAQNQDKEEFEAEDVLAPAKERDPKKVKWLTEKRKELAGLMRRRDRMHLFSKNLAAGQILKENHAVSQQEKSQNISRNMKVTTNRQTLTGAVFYPAYLNFDWIDYTDNLNYLFYRYYAPYWTDYIQVSFDYVDMEYSDYVKIYDAYGLCASYHGVIFSDFVSNTCIGDYVDIWVITDSSVSGKNGYDGFRINGFYNTQNTAPIAFGTANKYETFVGDLIQFSAANSYDFESEIIAYKWDFGDGSLPSPNMYENHVYTQPGDYWVTLRVEDTAHAYGYDGFWVSVYQKPPSIRAEVQTPDVSLTNPVRLTLRDTSSQGNRVSSVVIDWDDGSQTTVNPYKNDTYEHQYTSVGLKTIIVSAFNSGGTDTKAVMVNITGDEIPPFIMLTNASYIQKNQVGKGYKVSPTYRVKDDGSVSQFNVNFGNGALDAISHWDNVPFDQDIKTSYTYRAPSEPKKKRLAGVYSIEATATDNTTVTNVNIFTFETKNIAPHVAGGLSAVKKTCAGSNCSFTVGSVSADESKLFVDPDGFVADKHWEFMKPDMSTLLGCPPMNGRNASCTFPGPGVYYAKFTVNDNLGKSKSYFKKVTIK